MSSFKIGSQGSACWVNGALIVLASCGACSAKEHRLFETAAESTADAGKASEPAEPKELGISRWRKESATLFEGVECEPSPARCDNLGKQRPSRISEHATVYAQDRLEMFVHGGTGSIPMACAVNGLQKISSDLWIYDDPCGAWTRINSPIARARHMAAYGLGKMWVFGGRYRDPDTQGAYTLYNDLWTFDPADRIWREVDVSGAAPGPRYGGQMVWDSEGKRLWLFGGSSETTGVYRPNAELWSFSPETAGWTQHEVSDGAAGERLIFGMTFDTRRQRLVLFGGADTQASRAGTYRSDLWSFGLENESWERLAWQGSGPARRFFPGLIYDAGLDAYVVFGGHDDTPLGNRNETWLYEPLEKDAERAWVQYAHPSEVDAGPPEIAGDKRENEPRAVCDFPPDFTRLDHRSPERRSAHSMVYSEGCKHALVFGGKTDCGAIDDVWQFSLRAGWLKRSPALEGESCLRWREDTDVCVDLCF